LLADFFKLGFRRSALGLGFGLLSLRLLAERLLAAVALRIGRSLHRLVCAIGFVSSKLKK
jgi:hypothetical protein